MAVLGRFLGVLLLILLGSSPPVGAQELVVNGNIEAGAGRTATGWTSSSTTDPFYAIRFIASDPGVFCCGNTASGFAVPITGSASLLLTQTSVSEGYSYQTITIPPGAQGTLTFKYRAFVQGYIVDVDRVRVDLVAPGSESDPNSSLLQLLYVTNNTGVTDGLAPSSGTVTVSINSLAGQTVSIRAFARGQTYPANLAIDDVSVLLTPVAPTVASSVNPSALGQSVTLTATIAPPTATGSITFKDGTTTLCNAVPIVSGTATCTTSFTLAGAHPITAVFNGTGTYAGASATSAVLAHTVGDQRARTVETIGRFLGARNNQILTNQSDSSRQVDRLIEAGGGNPNDGSPASGFADRKSSAGFADRSEGAMASRLAGPDASDVSRMRFGGGRERGFDSFSGTDTNPFPVQDSSIGGVGVSGYRALNSELPGTTVSAFDQGSSGGSVQAGGLRMQGNFEGNMGLGFSTSLREINRAAEAAELRKAEEAGFNLTGSQGRMVGGRPAPFDLWFEAKYSTFRNDRTVADLDGHFGMITIGTDYVLNPRILVGTLVQFDSMQQRSNSQLTDVSGHGWMAGPYMTLRLSENVFLQARGAWGRSDNKVSPFLTYTDSFETQRWLVSSTLSGRWQRGAWSFRPSATVAYMEDDAKGYADTFGTLIPAVKSSLGQAKAGPEVGYRIDLGHTVIEPHAGVQAIWNFDRDVSAFGFGQLGGDAAGPEGVRGRAEVGMRIKTMGGLGVDVSGSYDGIGTDDYRSIAGRGVVRVPF